MLSSTPWMYWSSYRRAYRSYDRRGCTDYEERMWWGKMYVPLALLGKYVCAGELCWGDVPGETVPMSRYRLLSAGGYMWTDMCRSIMCRWKETDQNVPTLPFRMYENRWKGKLKLWRYGSKAETDYANHLCISIDCNRWTQARSLCKELPCQQSRWSLVNSTWDLRSLRWQ